MEQKWNLKNLFRADLPISKISPQLIYITGIVFASLRLEEGAKGWVDDQVISNRLLIGQGGQILGAKFNLAFHHFPKC